MQIMRGSKFFAFSQQNFLRQERIQASRGIIFDRNGTILVDNYPSFDVVITPQFLPKESEDSVIKLLSKLLQMEGEEIRKKLDKAKDAPRFQSVLVKSEITQDEVGLVKGRNLDLPGVDVQMMMKRSFLFNDVGGSLLGFVGEVNKNELNKYNKFAVPSYSQGDIIGKAGVELQFESTLRGIDGAAYIEVDAFGRQKLPGEEVLLGRSASKEAIPGNNLILTIDQQLQNSANEAFGNKIGSLVALDPNSGEILAMISRPSYNPTEFSRGIDPDRWSSLMNDPNDPLRNKAVQNHYPPGSAYKPFVLFSALERGVVNQNTTYFCPGHFEFGTRRYHCWKREGGHGVVNVEKGMAESCDVFFYRAGLATGIDEMGEIIKRFGLGSKTGVDLPNEQPGLIPTKGWKEQKLHKPWWPGETLSQSIGQGYVLATPLQLAVGFAAIANGGKVFKPSILKRVEHTDGTILKEFLPEVVRDNIISEPYLKIVQDGLHSVVNKPGGTAYWTVRGQGLDIAGKTGTVQVLRMSQVGKPVKCEESEFRFRDHGWFVGYAPANNPKIVVAAIAEHSCHGSSGAGPIVKAVIAKYLQGGVTKEVSK